MRRFYKIGLLFLLFLVVAAATAVVVNVRSDTFKEWMKSQIIATLQERFQVRVEIGSVDVWPFGAQVEIHNLQLFNQAYPGREPAIDVDRILLDFSITSFFSPAVSLDNLILDYPHVHLLEDANQKSNFSNIFLSPDPQEQQGEFSLPALGIKQLTLNRGLIFYKNQPFFLDSAQGGLATTLRFVPDQKKYLGHTSFDNLDLTLQGFRVTDLSLSLDFEFLENQLRVLSLVLDSNELEVHAEGDISDIQEWVYRFETDFSVDLAQLEQSLFSSHIQEGHLSLRGTLSAREGDFLFQGEARSDLVRWDHLSVRKITAGVSVDPQAVTLERLDARLYGGSLRGAGKVNWRDDGTSDLQVSASQVAMAPLLSDLGQETIQVNGFAGFTGQISWPGLRWGEASGQGQLSYQGEFPPRGPTENPNLPALSFQGDSSISFEKQELHLKDGVLRTPASVMNYSGSVTFPGAYRLELDLLSQQSDELFTLAGYTEIPEQFLDQDSVDLRGPIRISGTLEGGENPFGLRGTVRSERIFFKDELLGDFESQVRLSEDALQLDEARLLGPGFDLSTSLLLLLDPTEVRPLKALELQLNEVPIERFLAASDQTVPVEGAISGQLHLEQIALSDYRGSGRISVSQPRVYGQRLDHFSAQVELEGRKILLRRFQGSIQQGTVSGQVAVNLDEETYRVDIEGSRFPLDEMVWLQKRIAAKGSINFNLAGDGNFSEPNLELLLEGPRIVVGDHILENVSVQAKSRGEALEFRLQHHYLGNPFLFEGNLGLMEPYPVQATSELRQLPLGPYLQLIPVQGLPDVEGLISGRLTLAGPLKDPSQLRVEVAFPQFNLSMAGYELKNVSPLRISYQAGLATIDQLSLSGAETELQINGTVDLGKSQSVDLKMEGAMNLLVMNSFMPSGAIAGQLQLETVIGGSLSQPRIVGVADLKEGFLVHPQLPTTLFDAEGSLRFTANQVSLDSFSARTIYGIVSAEGGIFLEGLQPKRWQINVSGNGLRLEYPRNLISTLDVDLDLLKSDTSELISGAVYVRAAEYSQDISIPELMVEYARSDIDSLPTTGAPEVALDIRVEAYQSIRATNNLADVVASADLNARGTLQNPVIVGTLTIESGFVFLENNEYEISRGIVNFNNPRRTRPLVNLEAQTEIRDFTISVVILGPLDQLEFTFRSDPPLPTPSIVSLLAIGQTQEEILGYEGESQSQVGTLAVYGAGAILSRSFGEKLETRTSRLFGIEKFSIDPFLFGSERDPGARITLGKQLTKDLSVNYSTDLSSNQQGQIVVFEYKVTDWLTTVGTRDQDGSIAVDFKLKKRF
jgi:translocation and assembly module TamB